MSAKLSRQIVTKQAELQELQQQLAEVQGTMAQDAVEAEVTTGYFVKRRRRGTLEDEDTKSFSEL